MGSGVQVRSGDGAGKGGGTGGQKGMAAWEKTGETVCGGINKTRTAALRRDFLHMSIYESCFKPKSRGGAFKRQLVNLKVKNLN